MHEENHLNIHSDMTVVVKAMANPESGLEVRDRMWLKITIPNAFIGEKMYYCVDLDLSLRNVSFTPVLFNPLLSN